MATILVGHVTKDGGIAGPRVLEHMVDVVLHFEGERSTRLRMVRALKNRFGPVDEVGCFDLSSDGINAVVDPSGLFVSRHHQPVPGTCVSVTLEGRRPLLTEIQALVAPSATERPRRTSSGIESARFAQVAGGPRGPRGSARWPATTSSPPPSAAPGSPSPPATWPWRWPSRAPPAGFHLPADMIAIGEIGLAGELRRVPELERRLSEAARIGFKLALVSAEPGQVGSRRVDGLEVGGGPRPARRAAGRAAHGPGLRLPVTP